MSTYKNKTFSPRITKNENPSYKTTQASALGTLTNMEK